MSRVTANVVVRGGDGQPFVILTGGEIPEWADSLVGDHVRVEDPKPEQERKVAGRKPAPDPSSATFRQWSQWINDALMLIRLAAQQRGVDDTALDQDVIDYVVRKAVADLVTKPADSASQVSISVDDATATRTYSKTAGRMTKLPDDLLDLLFPTPGESFSIRPAYQPGCQVYNPYTDRRRFEWQ